jgi:hypothetical protein
MTASIAVPRGQRPIRLPFRVLAGIVGILGIVALAGDVLMSWRGVRALTAGDVLMLPLAVGFMRLMYHAVVSGTVPQGAEHWPLASRTVWNCYLILLIAHAIL